MPSNPITFVGPPRLRSPQPTLTGRSGVQITLTTRPRSTLTAPARVRLGRSVLVRGQTNPAVAGERIILRASRSAGSRRAFTVARARVAPDGRFSVRWRPRRRGTYGLYAIYRSQRAQLSDDSSPCNLPIAVR